MDSDLTYAVQNSILYLKAPRQLSNKESGNVLKELKELLQELKVTEVHLDLSECTYLDSTILGHLIAFNRRLDTPGLRLMQPSPEARQILAIMGINKLLPLEEAAPPPGLRYSSLPKSPENSTEDILRAHQLLSQLSPENAERFSLLLATLQKALQTQKDD